MAIAILPFILDKILISEFVNHFDDSSPNFNNIKEHSFVTMERRIRVAYKIADMMRKIRLVTFE